jgi:hypothetical protein
MHKILSIVAITILLCSCSQKTKKMVGLTSSGPDEYQVQKQKPLFVPPHYDLPPPPEPETKKKK